MNMLVCDNIKYVGYLVSNRLCVDKQGAILCNQRVQENVYSIINNMSVCVHCFNVCPMHPVCWRFQRHSLAATLRRSGQIAGVAPSVL